MAHHDTESELVQSQLPCEECGSSDAKAIYDDGHGFCFSCNAYFAAENSNTDATPTAAHSGDFQPVEGATRPLKKRHISAETCKKFGYTVAKIGDTPVQIANYYKDGVLAAQHVRYPDKDFSWFGKARGVQLFGQHIWRDGGKRLIITEGEIDAMTIAQVFGLKWQVVSLPNGAAAAKKSILQELEWIEKFDEVVLAFDDDEPGRHAVEEVAPLITPGKVKVMRYEGFKDANDLYRAKPDRVAAAVFESKTYRPDGIINGKELWDDFIQPPEKGLDLPYPMLTRKLQGVVPGELTIWTAGSGIGKTTAVREVAYHLFQHHDQRLGIVALEEPKRMTAAFFAGLYLNHPLHLDRDGFTEEQLREAFDATVGSGNIWLYDHFGSRDIDNLLAKLRYMAVGLGVSWIVLDHISIVVSGLDEGIGESERKMIDKLMTRMRSLCAETNVGIQAIVHLKRPYKGKSYNEGRPISLTDLRGSGSLEHLSDNVVAMERNQQNEDEKNFSQLRVLKCRRTGDTGKADVLEYNPRTGRLLPCEREGEDLFPSEDKNNEDF